MRSMEMKILDVRKKSKNLPERKRLITTVPCTLYC